MQELQKSTLVGKELIQEFQELPLVGKELIQELQKLPINGERDDTRMAKVANIF